MCGIAGIFDLAGDREIDRRALKRMTDALAHRGPDGEAFHVRPGVGLGHRRLAIVDLAGGAQPFTTRDGASVVIFNGMIYNYRDLTRRLADKGFAARTTSDTEILVEGLNAEGHEFIQNLRGMFAFAWLHAPSRTLTLARDRLGEKPLYYATTPDSFFVFASEIGAIRAAGLTPLRHSAAALRQYFLLGYVPDPLSIYDGVLKLPPGSTLTVTPGKEPRLDRYWTPPVNEDAGLGFDDAKSALLPLFDDAVKGQMISDVPLGAFLSGGVDSSAIVASMAQAGGGISTCTIGFDNPAFDERAAARATADRYGADHHDDLVRINAASLIDRIAGVYGEPFADPSALPTFEVSRAARRKVKVALSGDGGDEIFGGYRRYALFGIEERIRRLAPRFVRRWTFGAAGALYPKLDWAPRALRLKTTLQSLGDSSIAAYGRAVSVALPERLDRLLSADFRRSTKDLDALAPLYEAGSGSPGDPLDFAQHIDIATWLPGRMLTKVDRASMAHGLEVRAPFLDHRLVEWSLRLPSAYRRGRGGKRIFKAAQEGRVSGEILYRPKKGFSPPVATWLRAVESPAERLNASKFWSDSGCFSPRVVKEMIARHRRGVSDYSQELWMVIMFDAFLRQERA